MRIISGKARGLKLVAPEGLNTRPTADRIKESLFNMIASDIPNCNFLDLFSGSGAIGIEALSRGAKSATFVDNNTTAINTLKQNLTKSKLQEDAIIINNDVLNALNNLVNNNISLNNNLNNNLNKNIFDIIFLDPPYNKELTEPILNFIAQNNILNEDGFIICEQHLNEPDLNIKNLEVYKIKKYKITKMLFMQYS